MIRPPEATAATWWVERLEGERCRLLWPLAVANGERADPAIFCRGLARWLEARAGRGLYGLGRGEGPLLAGFLLEPPAPRSACHFTVVRLWLVEPARSGTVVRVLLRALVAVVAAAGGDEVRIPRTALRHGGLRQALDGPARDGGYMVAADGWRRRVGGDDRTAPASPDHGGGAMRRILPLVLTLPLLLGSLAVRAAELVMFESEYCEWCERWHEEIGPIYPKTWEGRVAPLRRVDVDEEWPEDLKSIRGIRYTPTFVLMEDGREVGRLVGYPGEDFFWPLLDDLLAKLPPEHLAEAQTATD